MYTFSRKYHVINPYFKNVNGEGGRESKVMFIVNSKSNLHILNQTYIFNVKQK